MFAFISITPRRRRVSKNAKSPANAHFHLTHLFFYGRNRIVKVIHNLTQKRP